jgi:hypothetical protein
MTDTIFMIHGMWGGPSNWATYLIHLLMQIYSPSV